VVALGNRLVVPKSVGLLPLLRCGLCLIYDTLGFFCQFAKLQANLDKHIVVTCKFTHKKLIFFLGDEAPLEVFNRLSFILLELDLAAEVVVEHSDLLKNLVDGLRCIVQLGDLEQ